MKRRSAGGASKKRAAADALAQLGMQAGPAEVAALLARRGVTVGEELVRASAC